MGNTSTPGLPVARLLVGRRPLQALDSSWPPAARPHFTVDGPDFTEVCRVSGSAAAVLVAPAVGKCYSCGAANEDSDPARWQIRAGDSELVAGSPAWRRASDLTRTQISAARAADLAPPGHLVPPVTHYIGSIRPTACGCAPPAAKPGPAAARSPSESLPPSRSPGAGGLSP